MRHNIEIPEGDVLIHAGDFSISRDSSVDLLEFAKWFQALPYKHKILVPGNHDWCFQNNENWSRAQLPTVNVLINEEVIIEGLKFYGTPYQPIFCDWAFNLPPTQLKVEMDKIPLDTNILITHAPPYGILDKVSRQNAGSVGCRILSKKVAVIRPKLHIFGHIHSGYGQYHRLKTRFINASLCDDSYKTVNKPIVVEV